MNAEEIATAADPSVPVGTSSVSLRLRKSDDGKSALSALFDVLGDDAGIALVEVTLDGAYVGTLSSESIFAFVVDGTMGMGDADRARLTGVGRSRHVVFHCRVGGCPQRIITVPDLNDRSRTCRVHGSEMEPDETA